MYKNGWHLYYWSTWENAEKKTKNMSNFCMFGPSADVINYATFHLYPRSSFCGA